MIDLTKIVSEELINEFGHIGNDSNDMGGSVHALSFAANSPHVKTTASVAGMVHKAGRKASKLKKKKLKQRYIKEETTSTSVPGSLNWEAALNKNEIKNPISTIWTNKFDTKFPDDTIYQKIIQAVLAESSHSSGYKSLQNYVEAYFPLIELIARFRDFYVSKDKEKIPCTLQDYEKLINDFGQEVKSFNSDDLLDFKTTSILGGKLVQQFSKKAETIGKFVLFPDFNKQSIWITVSSLLKRRQNLRSKTVKTIVIDDKKMDKFCRDLLVDFEAHLKTTQMPAEFEKEFSNNTLPLDVTLIGKLSFEYMQAEVERFGYDFSKPKTDIKTIFAAFLQNAALQDVKEHFSKMVGRLLEADTPVPAPPATQSKIFNWDQYFEKEQKTNESKFDNIYNDFLLEAPLESSAEKAMRNNPIVPSKEDIAKNVRANIGQTRNAVNASKFNKAFQNNNDQPEENSDSSTQVESFKGGYTIENINNSKTVNTKATPLIDALQKFANYISTEQKGDWKEVAGGIGQIAKGISSMGGPNQGPL